jgi:hypothetical protein
MGNAETVEERQNGDHKWLDFTRGDLTITFAEPTLLGSYDWMTSNDAPNRDPIKWALEGCDAFNFQANGGGTYGGADACTVLDDTYAVAPALDVKGILTPPCIFH